MAYKPSLSDINEIETSSAREATPEDHRGFVDHLTKSLSGIAHIPADLWHYTEGSVKDLFSQNPVKSAKQLYQGARSGLQNEILPAAKKLLIDYGAVPVARKLASEFGYDPFKSVQEYQIPHYEPDDPRSNLTTLGHFASMALPVGRVAKAGEVGARTLAELIPDFLGKKLATSIGAGGASGALAGSVVGSPEEGAITGALLPAGLAPFSALLRKSIRGRVTPEEFAQRRSEIPGSIRAPIGEIADSPSAKKSYATLANLVGSGAGKPYEQINELLKAKQSHIAMEPQTSMSPNEFVYKHMNNAYQTAREHTDDAYRALAKAADEAQTPFKKEVLNKYIDDHLNDYKKKSITESAKQLYSPIISALEDYKKAPLSTFSEAADQLPVVNDLIKSASAKNERPTMRSLMQIKTGIIKAMEESTKDNPELMNLYRNATQARREQGEFETLNKRDKTPFYKTYLKDADPGSLISQYIKPSKKTADHSALLDSIVSKIPAPARQAMAHEYLKSDTLPQFLNKLDSLNEKQRNILLQEHAPTAEHMLRISKIYPESRSPDFIPKTGYTGSKGTQAALLASGLANVASGNIKTGAGMLAAPFLGRGAQQLLRSETLKDLYQRALESDRRKTKISGLPIFGRTVALTSKDDSDRKKLTNKQMLEALGEIDD